MALQPISLNLLEDEFVCQCRYAPEDIRYADYLEEKAKRPARKVSPRPLKTRPSVDTRAKA